MELSRTTSLKFVAIIVFYLQYIALLVNCTTNTGRNNNRSSMNSISSGYQPTSGIEERWVAEEEFHGASNQQQHHSKKKKKKQTAQYQKVKDPQVNMEESWWDDNDDDDSDDDRSRLEQQQQQQSALPSTSYSTAKENIHHKRRHRLRIWKNTKKRMGGINKQSSTTSGGRGRDDVDNHSLTASDTSPSTNEVDNKPAKTTATTSSEFDEEHPMRTDEWKFDIQLSRLYNPKYEGELFPECSSYNNIDKRNNNSSNNNCRYRKRQVMQFARNGYVKILLADDNTNNTNERINNKRNNNGSSSGSKPKIGKWRIGHSGVAFDIPIQVMNVNSSRRRRGNNDNSSSSGSSSSRRRRMTVVLHYHADIHLNKFGERPRMFRGVITRDRHSSFLPPNFLRPVIGTFSAEGIGTDTVDTTYKERAISLSRQQVMNEARGEM